MDKKRKFIEELRSRLRLEDLIDLSGFKRVGDEFRGPHPVHGSTTGTNLSVNLDYQLWYCFRCHSGGDVFSWLAVEEGLVDCSEAKDISHVFPEVLRIACERVGMEFEPPTRDERIALRKFREEEQLLTTIFEDVVRFYRRHLDQHPEVKEWIREKYGDYWDDNLLDRFGIGYAPPEGDALTKYLIDKYGEENALKTGLIIKLNGTLKDFFTGRVVFPYFKRGKPVYFIARQTPWTPEGPTKEAKYLKQLRRSEKHPYVSELVEEPIYGIDSLRGSREVVITEGIADAISAIANGFPSLSPVTTRFKEDHVPELQKHIKDRTVYVVNDNEASGAGLKGALSIIRNLSGDIHLVLLPRPGDVEKVDLNDYFKEHTPDDFRELLNKAIPKDEALLRFSDSIVDIFRVVLKERGFDPDEVFGIWNNEKQDYDYVPIEDVLPNDLKLAIAIFRRSETHKGVSNRVDPPIKHTIISGVVLRILLKHGKFLRDDLNNLYYFKEDEKRVYEVSSKSDEFNGMIYDLTGLNSRTQTFKEIVAEAEAYALRYGEKVSVFRDFHYDPSRGVLYVYLQNGEYLALNGEKIEIWPNGANGIYFVKNKFVEPLRYIPKEDREVIEIPGQIEPLKGSGDLFIQAVCNRTSYDPRAELTVQQQRDLLALYYYSVPFGDFLATVPVLAFVGEKGSAKTFTARLFGRLLYGRYFDVTSIKGRGEGAGEGDFVAALSNWGFIALDNVDHPVSWLEDALAKVATRGVYRMRKLYTNAEEADVKIQSFVALTSRDPHFRRDDVVDRLLIIKTTRLDHFIPEMVLLDAVTKHRDVVFSEYVDGLNKIVKALKGVNLAEIVTPHRLADWVTFALIASEALGLDVDSVKDALEKLDNVRATFTVEADSFYLILKGWIETRNSGEWLTATQLYKELKEFSEMVGLDLYIKNPVSLGRKLQNLKAELRRLHGMETKYDTHEKAWLYRFPKPEEVFEGIKEDENSPDAGLADFDGSREGDDSKEPPEEKNEERREERGYSTGASWEVNAPVIEKFLRSPETRELRETISWALRKGRIDLASDIFTRGLRNRLYAHDPSAIPFLSLLKGDEERNFEKLKNDVRAFLEANSERLENLFRSSKEALGVEG